MPIITQEPNTDAIDWQEVYIHRLFTHPGIRHPIRDLSQGGDYKRANDNMATMVMHRITYGNPDAQVELSYVDNLPYLRLVVEEETTTGIEF